MTCFLRPALAWYASHFSTKKYTSHFYPSILRFYGCQLPACTTGRTTRPLFPRHELRDLSHFFSSIVVDLGSSVCRTVTHRLDMVSWPRKLTPGVCGYHPPEGRIITTSVEGIHCRKEGFVLDRRWGDPTLMRAVPTGARLSTIPDRGGTIGDIAGSVQNLPTLPVPNTCYVTCCRSRH